MKSKILILVAFFVTSLSFSQRNPNNDYLTSFTYKAKDGMTSKFEKAAGKKTKMFNSEDGNIIWTYKVVTGENNGVYERYMINQTSDSYNQDRSKELDYWSDNVLPYADAVNGPQRWMLEKWASVGEDGPPKKYLQKTTLVTKAGQDEHVSRWIFRTGQVIEKRAPNYLRRVFTIVSGGNPNMIVVFNAFDEYGVWGDSDNTFEEDYNEMFGWKQYGVDRELMFSSLLEWGEYVETLERVDAMLPN